jgi:hypothetical protein
MYWENTPRSLSLPIGDNGSARMQTRALVCLGPSLSLPRRISTMHVARGTYSLLRPWSSPSYTGGTHLLVLLPEFFGNVLLGILNHRMDPVKLTGSLPVIHAVFLLPVAIYDPNCIPIGLGVVGHETLEVGMDNTIPLHHALRFFQKMIWTSQSSDYMSQLAMVMTR